MSISYAKWYSRFIRFYKSGTGTIELQVRTRPWKEHSRLHIFRYSHIVGGSLIRKKGR